VVSGLLKIRNKIGVLSANAFLCRKANKIKLIITVVF
jgi:hypothetical protein